jgi:hypothetical protein
MLAQRIERRRPLASKQLASPTNSVWSSIDRAGANRWPGRPAGPQITARSTASLLLRRT